MIVDIFPRIEIADLLHGPNDDDLQCHQPGSSYGNVSYKTIYETIIVVVDKGHN